MRSTVYFAFLIEILINVLSKNVMIQWQHLLHINREHKQIVFTLISKPLKQRE